MGAQSCQKCPLFLALERGHQILKAAQWLPEAWQCKLKLYLWAVLFPKVLKRIYLKKRIIMGSFLSPLNELQQQPKCTTHRLHTITLHTNHNVT